LVDLETEAQPDSQAQRTAETFRRRYESLLREYSDATHLVQVLVQRQELVLGEKFRYRGIRMSNAIACEIHLVENAEQEEARSRARRAL